MSWARALSTEKRLLLPTCCGNLKIAWNILAPNAAHPSLMEFRFAANAVHPRFA